MNEGCVHRCAYKDICCYDKKNTDECMVWSDYPTQVFAYSTIMGYPTEVLLRKQYKENKDE